MDTKSEQLFITIDMRLILFLKNCYGKQTNCEILKILRDTSVESFLIILSDAMHLILVTSNFGDGTPHPIDSEMISN